MGLKRDGEATRADREAAALRENLRRRKAAARAGEPSPKPASPTGAAKPDAPARPPRED